MIQNQSTTFWRQSGEKRVLLLVYLDQYSVHLININIKPISCQHRPVQDKKWPDKRMRLGSYYTKH